MKPQEYLITLSLSTFNDTSFSHNCRFMTQLKQLKKGSYTRRNKSYLSFSQGTIPSDHQLHENPLFNQSSEKAFKAHACDLQRGQDVHSAS